MLVVKAVHLSVEIFGGLSTREDSSTVNKTIHCASEAISAHGSAILDVLSIVIAHCTVFLMSHEGEEGVVNPPSG